MTAEVTKGVMAAERRRCAAMLANDSDALDRLLDERLSFSHATGQVDDKPAYMAKMAARRIDYVAIDWSEERVIPVDTDAALLTGRMIADVAVEGVEKRLDNRVLAVWGRNDGEWRMIAFQSTPLKT